MTNDEMIEVIRSLQDRVAALELRPIVDWYGLWSADVSYRSGAMVTHQGHLWIAKRSHSLTEPGSGSQESTGWGMILRRPKGGKLSANYARQLIELVRNHLAATGCPSSTPTAERQETINASS